MVNMDIQYVLDPCAALLYIVSYLMKGKKDLTKIIETALVRLTPIFSFYSM